MNGWSARFLIALSGVVLGCGSDDGATGDAGSAGGGGSAAGPAGGGSGAGTSAGGGAGSSGAGTSAGGGAESPVIGGCAVFPAADAWNSDVSGADVDADWTSRLQDMVGAINLHPDYGRDGDVLYGIPINVVPQAQAPVAVSFDEWPGESDPGPYPFPDPDAVSIEGGDAESCDGDCHVLVVQQGACVLYEGYACHYAAGWHCANGAVWDLKQVSYGQRQEGWTSADAAGLAITPGILRYDEVQAGEVRHAIRFTTECSRPNYVAPATHYAVPNGCDENDPNSPPMGLRVRLRAEYDISGFSPGARAVLRAMQTYGMILADNGSNFFFQGQAHPDWNLDEIEELKEVPASEFEVIAPPPLQP